MVGWKVECLDGQAGEWTLRCSDRHMIRCEWTEGWKDARTDGCLDGRVFRQADAQMGRWTDGCADGGIDALMDRCLGAGRMFRWADA